MTHHVPKRYWRDTRRAVGVGGFKLLHSQLRDNGPDGVAAEGTPFADTVALGDYNDDCHHLASSVCTYPAYVTHPILCFLSFFSFFLFTSRTWMGGALLILLHSVFYPMYADNCWCAALLIPRTTFLHRYMEPPIVSEGGR